MTTTTDRSLDSISRKFLDKLKQKQLDPVFAEKGSEPLLPWSPDDLSQKQGAGLGGVGRRGAAENV